MLRSYQTREEKKKKRVSSALVSSAVIVSTCFLGQSQRRKENGGWQVLFYTTHSIVSSRQLLSFLSESGEGRKEDVRLFVYRINSQSLSPYSPYTQLDRQRTDLLFYYTSTLFVFSCFLFFSRLFVCEGPDFGSFDYESVRRYTASMRGRLNPATLTAIYRETWQGDRITHTRMDIVVLLCVYLDVKMKQDIADGGGGGE